MNIVLQHWTLTNMEFFYIIIGKKTSIRETIQGVL